MKSRGYTLIELMVVVAIIGIISAIAYPAYEGYINSTYQSQAESDLKMCSLKLEKYYSNGFTYVGADTANVCPNMWSPSDGPQSAEKFILSFPTLTKENYVIKAAPVDPSTGQCVELAADGTKTNC